MRSLKNFLYYDVVEFLRMFLLPTLFVLVIFCVAAGAVYLVNKATCTQYATLSPNFHWHFSFWTGCLVQTENGRWISPDRFFQLEQVTP